MHFVCVAHAIHIPGDLALEDLYAKASNRGLQLLSLAQ